MKTECCVVIPLMCAQLVFTLQFKIGVLVQEKVWGNFSDISDDVTTSGTTEVNFTVHRLTGTEASTKVCQLLEHAYGGFISFVDCPTAAVLQFQSNSRHIPHLLFVKDYCDIDNSLYTFHFFPPCDSLNRAVVEIASKLKWLDVVILHDQTLSSHCLQDLVSRFSGLPVSSRIINLKHGVRLELARKHDLKAFVVFSNLSTINNTLCEAQRLGMLTSEYSWVVVSDRLGKLPYYIETSLLRGRILFLRKLYQGMILANNTCASDWPVDSQISKQKALIEDAKSVFVEAINSLATLIPYATFDSFNCRKSEPSVLPHGNSLTNKMQKVSLTGNTGALAWSTGMYPDTSIHQICSVDEDIGNLRHMGTWNDGLNLVSGVVFGNYFTNFKNSTLIIATKPITPFVIFTNVNGTIKYSGFCFDILNELANYFHFKYIIVEPPDGMYGGLNADGSWNGMVGMVKRGEVDFAIGPFTITSIRETVIDFTVPYMEDGVGILTKRPDGEPNKIFKVFKPFSLFVWCCIGAAIIVVGTLLCLVSVISPFTGKARDSSSEVKDRQKDLRQNIWLIYDAYVEQGVEPRPTTFSGRSMLGCWWVFTILMTSTYTANLAANLTVSIPQQPINNLEELVAQTEIKPLVKSGTNIHTLFMTSSSGIYRDVWSMMSEMPKVTSNSEALHYVRQGKHAFMTDVTQLDYIVKQDCMTYSLADEIFNNAGLGFVLPEHSAFKDAFNLNIMKMQEAGMTERWRQEWWPSSDSCSISSRSSSAQALGMDSLAGLFYVYIAVIGLSVIVFASEIFYRQVLKNKIHPYMMQFKTIFDTKSRLIDNKKTNI